MIKKIYKAFQALTPRADYLAHFYFGFIYTLLSIPLYLIFNNLLWVLVPTIVIAGIKEYLDSKGNGKAEWLDFVFTSIPPIAITLIIYLV